MYRSAMAMTAVAPEADLRLTRSSGVVAPIPAIRRTTIGRLKSTHSRRCLQLA
jgi:hypothetical protein